MASTMGAKKIKILEAIRQGKVGGGETHVLELCTHIDKSLFEPVVLSFTEGPMVEELNRRGIKTKVINTERGFDNGVWKKVLEFIRLENFDIVHAHGTRAMSNVFWAARKAELPLIYTVHGWSFHPDQNLFIRKARELSENFLTSKANTTICVSKSNERDGIERFNMKRSTVIYNAVDLDKFNPENKFKDIRAEFGIANNKTIIGFIVRITVQKDPFTMIKAMKIVADTTDDVVLLMVGDGDLKAKTMQLAEELKIGDRIIFESFRSDIPDILNAIDIYCLPSLWEGFPIGILEAMAMRKCVVSSPVDGNIEVVTHNETGLLVETGLPEKLAEALLYLHNNKELQQRIAQNSYEFIKTNFGIHRLVKSVEEIYRNTI
jgi:glycosyltransferase involved in cell wall biosynthesis